MRPSLSKPVVGSSGKPLGAGCQRGSAGSSPGGKGEATGQAPVARDEFRVKVIGGEDGAGVSVILVVGEEHILDALHEDAEGAGGTRPNGIGTEINCRPDINIGRIAVHVIDGASVDGGGDAGHAVRG